ncbi:MAG TPA: FtsX-like permease family protein [Granulicella sp.]|nr:FtsX-like permease family protein [Granulicella sp.]
MFFRLLLESFRRQRRRKLLAGVAILLGTTAVTAMLALATTIGDRIHKELAVYGANLVVYPKTDLLDVKIGGVNVKPATGGSYLHESDLKKLEGIFWANNITGVSPELSFEAKAEATTIPAVGFWFHHALSDSLTTGAAELHPWWKLSGAWPSAADQAVVGAALARRLGLQVGDRLLLAAGAAPSGTAAGGSPRAVTVTGVVSTGDATDAKLLLPLATAQGIAGLPDAVSRVEVSARTKPEDAFARTDPQKLSPKLYEIWYCRPYANSIALQIREAIPGSQAEQVRRVEQSEGTVLERISGLMWLISAAALLAAGFAVSAAMATAILERRAEIGLMRSLGASRGGIAMLFYTETGLLAVLAGGFGYVIGSGLAAFLGAKIFTGDGPVALGSVLNPVLLPVVVGLALLVAVAGSTPSIRAALKLDPSAILRADA